MLSVTGGIVMLSCCVVLCCAVLWYMKGFNVFHKSVVCSVVWHELMQCCESHRCCVVLGCDVLMF